MGWELNIWPPDRSGAASIITNTAARGVEGGFKWQVKPDGDTVQLEFQGRNDRMAIPPRGVVQLRVDGDLQFWGIAADPPSTASPDAEKMLVLGGREALKKALTDGTVYQNMGVYAIARDLLRRLCPPALVYDPAQIGNGSGTDAGPTLTTYYSPFQPLDEALDALAKSANTTAGVDVLGRVFLGRPPPMVLSVAYAGQPWRRLQVQGQEAVTRAVLRLVAAPSLPNGARVVHGFGSTATYLPRTVTAVAELPEHSHYHAEKVVEVPEGLSAIKVARPSLASASSGVVGAGQAVDGDPVSSAQLRLGYADQMALGGQMGRVVGVQITYELPSYTRQSDFDAVFQLLHCGDGVVEWYVQNTQGKTSATAIVPPDALGFKPDAATWSTALWIGTTASSNPSALGGAKLYIYDVQFLTVDNEVAQKIAASFLQKPFGLPAEVVLPQLVPPAPTLTVTGSPDGNLSGPTSLFEYEHSTEHARTTRIKLGSTGQSQEARAIRFSAQDAAREVGR